jgi:predicted nucleic acid-binding protein
VSDFVCIDACVAIKWVLPEDDSSLALALYARIQTEGSTMIAPPHMPVEVLNAIWKKAGRGEITPSEADRALSNFLEFPISLASPTGLYETALRYARQFNRPTVYDTHYVALAEIAQCEMWTADQRLINSLDGKLPFVRSLAGSPDVTYKVARARRRT